MSNMWLIFSLTGSALHLGLTGLARALPSIIFSLIGGVIADRLDRRAIVLFTQATNGVFALVLGVLAATGLIEVWHVYAVTFLAGSLGSMGGPAQRSVIANLVPREHLLNAMSMRFGVMQLDRIIGPAIAGVLIAMFGFSVTYLGNAVAHAVTSGLLTQVDIEPTTTRVSKSAIHDLAEGFDYVRRRSVILQLLAVDGVVMFFGPYQVFLPIIADQFGMGSTGYGLLSSAPGVGAVLGALTMMVLGDVPYKGVIISVALLGYAVALIGLALSPWFVLALVALAIAGLTDSMNATTRGATIQMIAPDEFRGRVSAIQAVLQGSVPMLGYGAMGAVGGLFGVPAALVGGALMGAASNLGILAGSRQLRSRDLGLQPEPALTSARR